MQLTLMLFQNTLASRIRCILKTVTLRRFSCLFLIMFRHPSTCIDRDFELKTCSKFQPRFRYFELSRNFFWYFRFFSSLYTYYFFFWRFARLLPKQKKGEKGRIHRGFRQNEATIAESNFGFTQPFLRPPPGRSSILLYFPNFE